MSEEYNYEEAISNYGITVLYLMVIFIISDWYSADSGPVPIIASLVSGGVKSTVNPLEAASI